MDLDKLRAAVAREIEPLLADCEQMRAKIDRAEDALPIIFNKSERDVARVDIVMGRAQLEGLVAGLRGVEDRVIRLAREKWLSRRM